MKKVQKQAKTEKPAAKGSETKKQKTGTPDLRDKLIKSMVAEVEKICKQDGYSPDKPLITKYVESAVDSYVADWYEISLEAMDLMEGRADYVTDDEIDDPAIVREAKLRVIKNMYDERPPGIHEQVAERIVRDLTLKEASAAE